jgi:hypothetical protein
VAVEVALPIEIAPPPLLPAFERTRDAASVVTWMLPPAVIAASSPTVIVIVVVCFAVVVDSCTSTAPPVELDAEEVATPSPAAAPEIGEPLTPRNCCAPLPPPVRSTTSF